MVYLYCRELDSQTDGDGKVLISIHDLADLWNKSPQTIRRWFKSGKRNGLFHIVRHLGHGVYQVCYVALWKIYAKLVKYQRTSQKEVVGDLGAIVEVPVGKLLEYKLIATVAHAQHKQEQSRYRARRETKREIAKPSEILSASSLCQGVRGKLLKRKGGFIFVSEDFDTYGVSQVRIGDELMRHPRTIVRRLNHCLWWRKGLELKKVQVLRYDVKNTALDYLGKSKEIKGRYLRYRRSGDVYMFKCNVYDSEFGLKFQKSLRKRTKNKINTQLSLVNEQNTFQNNHLNVNDSNLLNTRS
jgi:hypothetical protein